MIKFKKNGFSIIELIIAGSISVTAIGIGYSLLQIALKGNKIDETQMGINGRINDTLDFILDEVKASKRIIDDESKIIVQNKNCTFPREGEFLFGISLPDQALVKSDYIPKGDLLNLNQIEAGCESTSNMLKKAGITCAPIDDNLLRVLLGYAQEIGYLTLNK